MNRVAGIVKTHLTDKLSWLILPWMILGSSFAVNLIIGSLIGDEIKTGGLASIFIYMLVLGIVSVGQTFPFLISFGVRRKDYFFGTAATVALVSAGSAILLLLVGYAERATDHWGIGLYFFDISYFAESSPLSQLWIFFGMMMNLFFCGFIIAAIYRKVGRNGLFGVFILLALALTCAFYSITYFDKWKPILDWFTSTSALELVNWLLVPTLVYIALSYGLLRKAST